MKEPRRKCFFPIDYTHFLKKRPTSERKRCVAAPAVGPPGSYRCLTEEGASGFGRGPQTSHKQFGGHPLHHRLCLGTEGTSAES